METRPLNWNGSMIIRDSACRILTFEELLWLNFYRSVSEVTLLPLPLPIKNCSIRWSSEVVAATNSSEADASFFFVLFDNQSEFCFRLEVFNRPLFVAFEFDLLLLLSVSYLSRFTCSYDSFYAQSCSVSHTFSSLAPENGCYLAGLVKLSRLAN